MRQTHDESGTLFLISSRKGRHRFEDLNPRIGVDENGVVSFRYRIQGGVDRRAANFDSNQGVELTDCSLKWCELEVLVRKDSVLGRAIGDTEGDAGL